MCVLATVCATVKTVVVKTVVVKTVVVKCHIKAVVVKTVDSVCASNSVCNSVCARVVTVCVLE